MKKIFTAFLTLIPLAAIIFLASWPTVPSQKQKTNSQVKKKATEENPSEGFEKFDKSKETKFWQESFTKGAVKLQELEQSGERKITKDKLERERAATILAIDESLASEKNNGLHQGTLIMQRSILEYFGAMYSDKLLEPDDLRRIMRKIRRNENFSDDVKSALKKFREKVRKENDTKKNNFLDAPPVRIPGSDQLRTLPAGPGTPPGDPRKNQ